MAKAARNKNSAFNARQMAMLQSYCKVNNLNRDVVSRDDTHTRRMNAVITDVWTYAEMFPGEDELQAALRRELTAPGQGERAELASMLRAAVYGMEETDDDWTVLYKAQNMMKEVVESLNEVREDSDKENIKKEEEKQEMSGFNSEVVEGAVDEAMNALQTEGGTDTEAFHKTVKTPGPTDSDPTNKIDDVTKNALQEFYAKTKQERLEASLGAKVYNVIIGSKAPKDRLVEKDVEKAFGTVANPERALENFMTRFIESDIGGVITWKVTFCSDIDRDSALNIYNELKAAKADPNKEFKCYIKKSTPPAIKGIKFKESAEGAMQIVDKAEFLDYLMTKTLGEVGFVNKSNESKAVVQKATRSSSSQKAGDRGIGVTSKKGNNKSARYKGIAVFKLSRSAELIEETAQYWKETTENQATSRGISSEHVFKYSVKKQGSDNATIRKTYRIPLLTLQYEIVVKDKDLEVKFGNGERTIGAAVIPSDFSDSTQVDKALAMISELGINTYKVDNGFMSEDFGEYLATAQAKQDQKDDEALGGSGAAIL